MDQPTLFTDVNTLLEVSQPKARLSWGTYGLVTMVLLVLFSSMTSGNNPQVQQGVQTVTTVAMFGVLMGVFVLSAASARALRREQTQLLAAKELVQLRHWPQAAVLLQSLLSRPTRTQQGRIQALLSLSSVLTRFHRFDDVITIDEYLLSNVSMDEATAASIQLTRAMAMLREDRLLDADRAISELRRNAVPAAAGALVLVQLYRDVKTGHPREAIDLFQAKFDLLRQQLGHRLADAYALLAAAHDLLQEKDQAAAAYAKATLLAPPAELLRRYPEVSVVAQKYPPTFAPPEFAGPSDPIAAFSNVGPQVATAWAGGQHA